MRYGALLFIVALAAAPPISAQPIARAERGDLSVTLTDEKCQLPAVSNLKYRAEWHEKGKVFQGCYGQDNLGLILLYFEDKTVVAIPASVFTLIRGT